MDLVRDVLDKQVIDRNGRPMGRVDGIVLELRDGAPPRVDALAIGPAVLGERLHPAIGRWVKAVESVCGVAGGRPLEIAPSEVTLAGDQVRVDRALGDSAAAAVEQGVRKWIRKLPFA